MLWCCMAPLGLHVLVLPPNDMPGLRMGPLPVATRVHIVEKVGLHLGLDGLIPAN